MIDIVTVGMLVLSTAGCIRFSTVGVVLFLALLRTDMLEFCCEKQVSDLSPLPQS